MIENTETQVEETKPFIDPDEDLIDRISREYGIDKEFIRTNEDGTLVISDPVTGETYMDDPISLEDIQTTETIKESPVFVNKLDEVLKKVGYDISEIDFGDGNVKSISELTDEEQIEILVQQLSQQSSQSQGPQLSQDELNLVEFLRSGKTPRELAESILESDLSFKYSKMSDEDVVREYLTKEKLSYTPEEIEEEIEEMKSRGTKLAREAKDIRLKYTSTAQIPQVEPDVDYEKEVGDLITYAKGVDVPASVKNDVLNYIIPKSKMEESELIKYMSTPDALFNIGYLLTQYDNILKTHQQELKLAREQGKKEALGQL